MLAPPFLHHSPPQENTSVRNYGNRRWCMIRPWPRMAARQIAGSITNLKRKLQKLNDVTTNTSTAMDDDVWNETDAEPSPTHPFPFPFPFPPLLPQPSLIITHTCPPGVRRLALQ